MDAAPPSGRPAALPPGGTVEPANRAEVAKARFQTPRDQHGERYELRDPFAEVTYRTSNLGEMVAKAQQLGSSRFTAVDAQGTRTPIEKVGDAWQRGTARAAEAERPLAEGTSRDEPSRQRNTPTPDAPTQAPATTPNHTGTPTPNQAQARAPSHQPPLAATQPDAGTLARLDAQAERAAQVVRLQAALQDRYVIKRAPVTVGDVTLGRTEYRFKGDTSRVAFTESTFRLATDTNSPSVARSMVDVAEARNWKALRVSGNEDFKRMVWLEATVRGVKTVGYEPNPGDLEVLKREREARLVNRIEPARDAGSGTAAASAEKTSARGGGGRKAVLAAIDAVLVAKNVPETQRAAVLAAATEKLAQRMRDGQAPQVKVYDKTAPSKRPEVVPTPEQQRTRDRTAPAPAR